MALVFLRFFFFFIEVVQKDENMTSCLYYCHDTYVIYTYIVREQERRLGDDEGHLFSTRLYYYDYNRVARRDRRNCFFFFFISSFFFFLTHLCF